MGDDISTVGNNISTVEGINYSGGRILISACLVINNEKISTFFVLRYKIFIRKFFRKFKQISCYLRAGLVYPGPTLFRNN